MDDLIDFYKRTWWLWVIFVITFILLGYFVVPLFYIFIPGLLGYSVYFGMVRASEEREQRQR